MPWLTVPAEPSHLASPAVCVFPAEASDIMEQRPIIPAMLCLNPWPIESGSRVNCFVPCFRVICYAAIDDQYSCASWDVPCSHLRGPNQTIFSSWPLSSWLGSHSACKSLLQGKGTGLGVVVWWWWGAPYLLGVASAQLPPPTPFSEISSQIRICLRPSCV